MGHGHAAPQYHDPSRATINLTLPWHCFAEEIASQLKEHEAVARKTAAALSTALSIAEYVYNQPELSEESRLGLHQIKLDLVAGANYAWRSVHNHMLMRRVVLDNLAKTIPLIDPNQRVALLHPFYHSGVPFSGVN